MTGEPSVRAICIHELESPPSNWGDIRSALEKLGYSITEAPGFCSDGVRPDTSTLPIPDVLLISIERQSQFDENVLQGLMGSWPDVPIIAIIENVADSSFLINLLRIGASDFISHPYTAEQIHLRILRLLNRSVREDKVVTDLKKKYGLSHLVGENPQHLREIEKIKLVASTDSGVLVMGETGTGKELFARAIHHLSQRSGGKFVPVDCGALHENLAEGELFGYERGAFTSAVRSHEGLIREANCGTLFLDEIDSLRVSVQVKLLRLLQEKEYRALGSTRIRRADIRVVAATNAPLGLLAQRGEFRPDLYYRLNVVNINLPPLRARGRDIELLARHFLRRYTLRNGLGPMEFSKAAIDRFMTYNWPGNVRELQNAVERSAVFADSSILHDYHIELPDNTSAVEAPPESFQEAKARVITQFEHSYIDRLLSMHNGNISRAAKAAKKDRRAFFELIRKHKFDVEQYREQVGQAKHPVG